MKAGLFSFAFLFLFLSMANATVYYISPTGNAKNDCLSLGTACPTIQPVAWKTRPGDTVVVNTGVYYGGFIVPFSGTADKHITYMVYPGATVLILLSTSDWWGIAVPPGISYIDIVGFRIIGSAQQVSQAQAADWASKDLLYPANAQSCIIIGGDVTLPPAHHVTVYKNDVSFCPGSGVNYAHSDYINILNNRIHDNSWWNWNGASGVSIYEMVNSDGFTGTKNFIMNNVVYANVEKVPNSVLGFTDGNGIVIDKNENTDHTKILYNARTYIANNVVYQNGGNGIIAYYSRHVDIVNNSTYANNASSINRGEIQANLSSDINVFNNIMVAAPGKAVVVDGQSSDVHWDYNIVYGGNALSIYGPHDIWANPNYQMPSTGLFQLSTPLSPAVGTGTFYLAPSTDILGVQRTRYIDRGAYQSF